MVRYGAVADRLWRRIATISFILALVLPIGLLLGFRLIVTSSVPKGLWYVRSGMPLRGNYTLVCLPGDLANLGKRAGYLMDGFCPGHSLPLMKRVVAVAGDVVQVSQTGITVNGALLPDSRPLSRDSKGRPIPGHVSGVANVVPAGTIWVLGDWYKSWILDIMVASQGRA